MCFNILAISLPAIKCTLIMLCKYKLSYHEYMCLWSCVSKFNFNKCIMSLYVIMTCIANPVLSCFLFNVKPLSSSKMIVQAVLLFLVSVIFFFALKKDVWGSKAPPHPPLQAIVGNLLMMQNLDSIIHFAFHSLSQSFGNVFRLRLGLKWNLVLTGYNELKVNTP